MTPVYRRECPQQNTLSLERVDPTHRPEARAQAGTARLTTGAKAPTLAAGFFCQMTPLWWRRRLLGAKVRPRCAGLLRPALRVHTPHEEPQTER